MRTQTLNEKKLLGKSQRMSFSNNTTSQLWQWFQPRRAQIKNVVSTDLYSVEIYSDASQLTHFNPNLEFIKWGAVEVSTYDEIPEEMEKLIIPGGLYAVFLHKGDFSKGMSTYAYIFQNWLPASEFSLDNRPHFAVMGAKYKGNSSDSEEEIWIPVKYK